MQRSDAYFISCMVGYLVVIVLTGFVFRAVPSEVLQLCFMLVLLLPLVWPRMGRWVGVEPLWSSWRKSVSDVPAKGDEDV
jgi:hypothetical protein